MSLMFATLDATFLKLTRSLSFEGVDSMTATKKKKKLISIQTYKVN